MDASEPPPAPPQGFWISLRSRLVAAMHWLLLAACPLLCLALIGAVFNNSISGVFFLFAVGCGVLSLLAQAAIIVIQIFGVGRFSLRGMLLCVLIGGASAAAIKSGGSLGLLFGCIGLTVLFGLLLESVGTIE